MKEKLLRIVLGALTCAFALGATAQDALKLPDTKAGQQMTEWLKLCDAADIPALTKWAEANLNERAIKRFGAEGFARRFGGDCAENGGYEFLGVVQSTPEQIEVATRGRKSGAFLNMRVGLDPQGKVRIGERPATPPESALPQDVSDKSVEQAMRSHLDKLAATDQFSGIAILARGTQPIVAHARGYADKSKKSAITPQTQFTLGSMGKLFTAASIGQLVDQGKLSFNDVVGKFFPEFGNKTVREKVTVGMLLSHTSGMGDFLAKRTPEMMKNGVKRAAEFIPLYENDELQFEPGKEWSYSNAGLALAGAIIEKVSGEDYPSYIRKHVFEVAGMKNSDPNNVPHVDPRMVVPYTKLGGGDGTGWNEAERDIGSPAGGAISTAEDLMRFADALRNGKLVSRATFEELTRAHAQTPFGGNYGYGIQLEETYGRKVIGHGGGFPGVSTDLILVLDSPYTAVVLGNQDPPSGQLASEMAKALLVKKAKTGS